MSLPDFRTLRQGQPDCPSDFTLDRLHAGELSQAQAGEVERHVAGCAECGARMTERRAGFGAIDGAAPGVMLARIRAGLETPAQRPLSEKLRGWWGRVLPPVVAVAATAAVLVLVVQPQVESPTTRMKGALGLRVFRLSGDHAEEVFSGDTFAPGDRLRFAIDLPVEGHVALLGVESSGALYTAWPNEPESRTRFAGGTGLELPGAVELDAQPGREVLHLVLCPLEVGPPDCTSGGAGAKPVCPEGCVSTPFILEKKQ